jgi:NTP pyrophosphatase (non-canonical NTP hydrolase)
MLMAKDGYFNWSNRMNKLFKKQQDLQELLTTGEPDGEYVGDLCGQIRNMAFYLNQEVVELIEEIAGSRDINKPWKNSYIDLYLKETDLTDKVRSEAIDVLKFAMNICLLAGITPENITEEFNKVHQRCIERYENGY